MDGDLQQPLVPPPVPTAVTIGSSALAPAVEVTPPTRSLAFMRPRSIFDLSDAEIQRLKTLAQMHTQLNNFKLITVGFDKSAKLSEPEYFMIMLQGLAIGIDPMVSLSFFNIIDGKLAINAAGMMAKIQASGLLEDMKIDSQDSYCEVAMKRKGVDTPHVERFTMEQAKALNFTGKKNWQMQPRNMLKLRALSACGRILFSDVINGLYTTEELEDFIPDAPIPMPTLREVPRSGAPSLSVLPKPAAAEGEPVSDDDYEPPFGGDAPQSNSPKAMPHWATIKANQDQLVTLMKQHSVGASEVLDRLHPGQNITKWSESPATFPQIKETILAIAHERQAPASTEGEPGDWFENLDHDDTPRSGKPASVKGARAAKASKPAAQPEAPKPATWRDDDEIREFLSYVWDTYNRDPREFIEKLGATSVSSLAGKDAAIDAFRGIAIANQWEMVATSCRYVNGGNNQKYLEFDGPIPIRQYGRSTSFKQLIGEEWYNANQVDTWTEVGKTYTFDSALEIKWENKDGKYCVATGYSILEDSDEEVE